MQVAARRSTLAARVVAAAPTARPLARGLRLAVARRPLAAAPLVASARALARATPLPTRLSARGLATLPSHTVLTFPALSPTMTTGTIASWDKKEGDAIKAGDSLAQVETDKATVSFESQEEGFLAKILVPGGTSDVNVGRAVAIMVESAADVAAFKNLSEADFGGAAAAAPVPKAAAPATAPAPAAAAPAPAANTTTATATATATSGARPPSSPLARKIAREAGVSITALAGQGSGPDGRIIRADVEAFLASGGAKAKSAASAATSTTTSATPATTTTTTSAASASAAAAWSVSASAPAGKAADLVSSGARRAVADLLTESKRVVPHYYLTSEIGLDAVLDTRAKLNASLAEPEKLSVQDFVVKAAALALRKVPEVNSAWLPHAIRTYEYADIAVAVGTDHGIMHPVLRDADKKGLQALAADARALASKAKSLTLAPEDVQGATFTITNLGAFGVRSFAAVILPPQAAILAVGAAQKRIVPNEAFQAGVAGSLQYKTTTSLFLTLSCDHRVIDGAVGAQYLAVMKNLLENPLAMLL